MGPCTSISSSSPASNSTCPSSLSFSPKDAGMKMFICFTDQSKPITKAKKYNLFKTRKQSTIEGQVSFMFQIKGIKCLRLYTQFKFFVLQIIIPGHETLSGIGTGKTPSFDIEKKILITFPSMNNMLDCYIDFNIFGFNNEDDIEQYKTQDSLGMTKEKIVSFIKVNMASFVFGGIDHDYELQNKDLSQSVGRLNINVLCRQVSNVSIKLNELSIIKTERNDNEDKEADDDKPRVFVKDMYICASINNKQEQDIIIKGQSYDDNEVKKENLGLIINEIEIINEMDYNELMNSLLVITLYDNNHDEEFHNDTKGKMIGYSIINLEALINTNNNPSIDQGLYSSLLQNDIIPFKEILLSNQIASIQSLSFNHYQINYTISIKSIPNITPLLTGIINENGINQSLLMLYYTLINPKKEIASFKYIILPLTNLKDYIIKSLDQLKRNLVLISSLSLDKYFSELRSWLTMSTNESYLCYHYSNERELLQIQMTLCQLGIAIIEAIEMFDIELIMKAYDLIELIESRGELSREMIDYSLYGSKVNNNKRNIKKGIIESNGFLELYYKYYEKCFYLLELFDSQKIQLETTKSFSVNKLFVALFYKSNAFRQKVIYSLIKRNNESYDNQIIYNELPPEIFWDITDIIKDQSIHNESIANNLSNINSMLINQDNTSKLFYLNISNRDYFTFSFIYNLLDNLCSFKISTDNPLISSSYLISSIKQCFSIELSSRDLTKYPSPLIDLIFYFTSSPSIINSFTDIIIKKTNAYDVSSIYFLIDYLHRVFTEYSQLSNHQGPLSFDYSILIKIFQVLKEIDNSLSLTKLIWLYYSNAHLMPRYHLMELIELVLIPDFEVLFFHWSWKVRKMIYMFLAFILDYRIKGISPAFDYKINLLKRLKKTYDSKVTEIIDQDGYDKIVKEIKREYYLLIHISIKDYREIDIEFEDWKAKMAKMNFIEYPSVFIILQKEEISDNIE